MDKEKKRICVNPKNVKISATRLFMHRFPSSHRVSSCTGSRRTDGARVCGWL